MIVPFPMVLPASHPRHLQMMLVTSSNASRIGYDPGTRVLAIEYRDSGVYYYADVPPRVFSDLQSAISIGKFLHMHVKGKYRFSREFPVLTVAVHDSVDVGDGLG